MFIAMSGRIRIPLLILSAVLPLCASIKEQSPFLPPNHGVVVTKTPTPVPSGILAREIELRGVIQIGDTFQFSVFNKKENLGYWISENESANGISVRDFDAGDLSLTVTKNGRSERLSLVSANEKPLPIKNSGPVISRTPTAVGNAPKPAPLPVTLQGKATPAPPSGNVVRRRVVLPK